MMRKSVFHIVDREFGTEYDYEAYFTDEMEEDRFITENEHVGNTLVYVCLPVWVPIDEVPEDHF